MDTSGKSDPFVEVLLVPGKHVGMKTKVIRNNLNPVFDNDGLMNINTVDCQSVSSLNLQTLALIVAEIGFTLPKLFV